MSTEGAPGLAVESKRARGLHWAAGALDLIYPDTYFRTSVLSYSARSAAYGTRRITRSFPPPLTVSW